MRIDYHNLYDSQFERLVGALCHFILGPAVQEFSSGPDGGRDARFTGTACEHPLSNSPAAGKFIVQAKHTEDPVAKLSEPSFGGDADLSVLSSEILKLTKLRGDGDLDHYLLFTNRRASGNATFNIENRIINITGIPSAWVCGIETLDRLLKAYPEALRFADLDSFEEPLRIIPDEIAEVVLAMSSELSSTPQPRSLERERYAAKNKRNEMNDEFGQKILKVYGRDFIRVAEFLQDPANEAHLMQYESAAASFDAEVLERRGQGRPMDSLLNSLVHRILTRDPDLSRNSRLTRTVVYYMYWICDLGTDDADS